MNAGRLDELLEAAQAWIADDPDATTRQELQRVVDAARAGDGPALTDLRDRFSGLLQFGTAGLRGALGAGPARMNRVVVIRAAAGLTAYLQETKGTTDVAVVIGYDARHNSDVFARDTAAVVVAAGGHAMVMPHPLPTPVLAYAIRHLGADAGVMVTASHNPPQDNGYKVYLGDGSQIVPPADGRIAAAIDRFPRAAQVPLVDDGWQTLPDEITDDYLDSECRVVTPGAPRDLRIVHTSLHGVGDEVMRKALARTGFQDVHVVADQAAPDPEFPTVPFPNPEEPGAIDHALDLARRVQADIVIANDPDADRCAVAIDGGDGDWRMLRGDEVGAILGAHLLARGVPDGRSFANSIVSSRLLAAMAHAGGVHHEETLTGFKWISRVDGLAYGYEEALGYCVDPEAVRDKDGISAGLLIAQFAAELKAQGRTFCDVLDELAAQHGHHLTDAFSVRVADLSRIATIMSRLRSAPPSTIGGHAVARAEDLSEGGPLPPTEGLRYFTDDDTRVIVRPSGTEPKLKIYLEAIGRDRVDTAARLAAARADLERLTTAD